MGESWGNQHLRKGRKWKTSSLLQLWRLEGGSVAPSPTLDMHFALQIHEILELICDFADKNTLASLIRTCRTFEESSRNVLWRELDSLTPLLTLFPDITLFLDDDELMCFFFPSAKDLNRMVQYTSRVTKVCLEFEPSFVDQFELELRIIELFTTPQDPIIPIKLGILFPKLKTVHSKLPLDTTWSIPVLHWVNGPSLVSIHLEIPREIDDERTLDFVASLSSLYPNATTVVLERPGLHPLDIFDPPHIPDMPLYQSLSRAIQGWKHLVDGTFYGVDAAAYQHLSQLQSLTTLHLTLQPDFVQCLRQARLPPKPFPALSELILIGHGAVRLSEWLDSLRLSPSIFWCTIPEESEAEEETLYSSIAAALCHRSLEGIWLQVTQEASGSLIDLACMRPLFAFTQLRWVTLTQFTVFIDDDDLQELASAWPLLETLHLNEHVPCSYSEDHVRLPHSLTLRGFLSVIKSCPRLRELSIAVDMGDLDVWDSRQGGVSNALLTNLNLGNSLVHPDYDRVSAMFGELFPSLLSFSLCGDVYMNFFVPGQSCPCLNCDQDQSL